MTGGGTDAQGQVVPYTPLETDVRLDWQCPGAVGATPMADLDIPASGDKVRRPGKDKRAGHLGGDMEYTVFGIWDEVTPGPLGATAGTHHFTTLSHEPDWWATTVATDDPAQVGRLAHLEMAAANDPDWDGDTDHV